MGIRIVILSKNTWGLGQDAKIVEQVLRETAHGKIESIDHIDPVCFYGGSQKPHTVDIQIHMEIPCRAAWKWAKYNIVVVNQEWWRNKAWDWAFQANMFIFKSHHARQQFLEYELPDKKCRVISWRASSEIQTILSALPKHPPRKEFLYLLGGSLNKLAVARTIVSKWDPDFPPLTVVGTDPMIHELVQLVQKDASVSFQRPFVNNAERITAQASFAYHVVASSAEGYGYTFAEAAAVGAIPLWTAIPVYCELWEPIVGNVGKIECGGSTKSDKYRDSFSTIGDIRRAVQSIVRLDEASETQLRGLLRHTSTLRVKEFRNDWKKIMNTVLHWNTPVDFVHLPPKLPPPSDLPSVAVITLTHNRPQWFANMARNILTTTYPKEKLTWIVADDGTGGGRVDGAMMKFQEKHPEIQCKYLSFTKPMTIGYKRNQACYEAPVEAQIFLMMDDDDHYPPASISARVAWLQTTKAGCVYCSTIPIYDCKKYISAMNVPPLDLPPTQRVSEATFAFTRDFFYQRPFANSVHIAEGEGFVADRIDSCVEIPPEGIIVSFLHGKNTSSRRVPDLSEPNGCHYGFDDDYFSYLSSME